MIPTLAVFTKYDEMVSDEELRLLDMDSDILEQSDSEIRTHCDSQALKKLEPLVAEAFRGAIRAIRVSIKPQYENTVQELVIATDDEVQKHFKTPGHLGATSLAWVAAQRSHEPTNIDASIEVGQKKYWSSISASVDFEGKKLDQCLAVLHDDIIKVWNIHDGNN